MINPDESVLNKFYAEIGTTSIQLKKDVALVKTWLELQPHLPNIEDDVMLEIMLMRCKGSVEVAKQTWDLYFTLRGALPEVFANRDPLNPEIEAARRAINMYVVPRLTESGSRIVGHKFTPEANGNITVESILKYIYMGGDLALAEDKSVSTVFLYDYQHVNFDYFIKWTVPVFKKLDAMVKMYKFRIQAIHFINAPPAFDMVLGLLKSVMKSKLVSRIHVHRSLDSLHEHVDRKLLPREYGGEEKSPEELANDLWSHMLSQRDWFLQQEALKADEAKRPGKSFNVNELFGFQGTFKKLDVD